MRSVIYANVTPHETRVAVREDGQLTEILLERARDRSIVGSLFKGRISRVLPGMQAAFVDIGLERDAFLYVDDVVEALEDEGVDATEVAPAVPIQDLLHEGQELVVQITRETGTSKGPRASSHITVPGRYLVLLPGSSHVGVSRRITDQAERDRLRALLSEIPRSAGVIVRTAGEGRQREDFVADLAVLESLNRHIMARAQEVSAPCLLWRDLDLVLRAARDLAGPHTAEFWVDDADAYQRVLEFLDRVQPEITSRIKLYRRRLDLFEAFSIQSELDQLLQPKVWLRSGGSLVINQTEALVAIDVNSGRYVGGSDLEDTVFRTNLEAAAEVARQLRLRNLGGIIVVDFIDMEMEEHRQALLETLRSELAKDRARTLVGPVGPFGLVQLTRKRTERSLERSLTQPCPMCAGLGRIKSPETMCLEVRRAVLRVAAEYGAREVTVRVNPEVARLFAGDMRGVLEELRGRHGIEVRVFEAPELTLTRYDVSG